MSADGEAFIEALLESGPPPPCDGCSLRTLCADQQLACERFAHYILIDPPRSLRRREDWDINVYTDAKYKVDDPTRKRFDWLYDPNDDKRGGRPPDLT